jgi:uncharacterized protein (TIGR02284 family)
MHDASPYRSGSRVLDNNDVVDIVNDLIGTAKDREYGFRTCAEHCERPELRALFRRRAIDCQEAAQELADLVVVLGGEPEASGSASGTMRRGWLAVRLTLFLHDELSMLEACERGEDTAFERYRNALMKNLPAVAMHVLRQQCEAVLRNYELLRDRRDLMRATAT